MSRFLCDSGVWLAATDDSAEEPFHQASLRLVNGLCGRGEEIGALDLTLYEVANVATCRWREPRTATALADLVASAAASSLVAWNPELLEQAVAIAGKHGISVYDAAYAATSQALGWTLVSTDLRDLVRKGLAVTPDQVVI